MRLVAADTTGTMTSVLSTSMLIQAFSNRFMLLFQVNFCTPSGGLRVTPAVNWLGGPGSGNGSG